MRFDLKRLEHLVTVARLRSFSRAASELGLTQPAVSRSIATLETSLNVRIFDRDPAGIELTAVGTEIVNEAEYLLNEARIVQENMALQQQGQIGSVTFGISPLYASVLLPHLLAFAAQEMPKVKLSAVIFPTGVEENLDRVIDGSFEFIICSSAFIENRGDLDIEKVGTMPTGLFVRDGHPLLGKIVNHHDINQYPFATSSFSKLGKALTAAYAPTLICSNYDILAKAVAKSDAIWPTSPFMIVEELKSGKLKNLNIGSIELPVLTMAVIRLKRRTLSESSRVLLSEVRNRFEFLLKATEDTAT